MQSTDVMEGELKMLISKRRIKGSESRHTVQSIQHWPKRWPLNSRFKIPTPLLLVRRAFGSHLVERERQSWLADWRKELWTSFSLVLTNRKTSEWIWLDEKKKFRLVLQVIESMASFSPHSLKKLGLDFTLTKQRTIWRDIAMDHWKTLF